MLQNNTKKVNKIMVYCLAWCSLVLIVLLGTILFGLFNYNRVVIGVIIVVGISACYVPLLLYKLGIPDELLKYYIHVAISLLIGLLGMQNDIGIYITYILVPIISCMYFDRKLTLYMGGISYLIMAFSVFINSAGKMEVKYYGWSHLMVFVMYMIGFTLEYLVCMIFLYQVVLRSQKLLLDQQDQLKVLQQEEARRMELNRVYEESLSGQKKTAFRMLDHQAGQFSPEDIARISGGHKFTAQIQDMFILSENFYETVLEVMREVGDYFGIDRIFYLETSVEEKKINLTYQWSRKREDFIEGFQMELSREDYESISHAYDTQGYLEFAQNAFYLSDAEGRAFESELGRTMLSKLLGTQLWIPTLEEGKYNGAICFDKYNGDAYSVVDKILLNEIVGIIATNIIVFNAKRANRAKSVFLSTMSHEIRTPMNVIIGMSTAALREEMSEGIRKSLCEIRSSADGLLTIINDILDFSKIESGNIDIIPTEYNTLSLLNDVRTIVSARNEEKGLALTFDFPGDLPSVLYGDVVRIRQVMVNLGNNAVKYTDSGTVTLRVRVQRISDESVNLHFEVQDTGQGIREEDLEKLFRAFSQVNRVENHQKEGTGLGLAISKKLVELMNGSIGVDSTYGKGSTFYFDLPQGIVDDTPAGALEKYEITEEYVESEDDGESLDLSGKRVLIVDDTELNLIVAESLFSIYGMEIDTAEDGKTALDMTRKNRYDLIFMDHFMPDMDGKETTRRIRGEVENCNRETPIVALTADAVSEDRDQMTAAGMNDFLYKPINMKEARRIFQKYLLK